VKVTGIGTQSRRRHLLALACASCLLTGCVTSDKYKLAKKDTPPATLLTWTASTPPAELILETVIVYQGPGTWKLDARWDEYVVRITNHGDQPLQVDSATLIDLLGQPQLPGDDPWKLEKISYTNWDKYGRMGTSVVLGVGAAGAFATGALYAGLAGSAAAASSVLIAFPVLLVADVGVVAAIDHNNKGKVEQEFTRRRIVLPLTVAPGVTARGSFFFPMAPGPQRLTLKGKAGDSPLELVLELKPLAGLHLKPAEMK
jgi:hypothetical protein